MWATVIEKFLDFLNKPNALGVLVVLSLLAVVVYALPLAVVTWTSYDNTNRLEKAITSLSTNCFYRMAKQKGEPLSE